ncbi:hypothetical protein CPC08DRAFT_507363 [Agrocybe pediades]|nr:hypothetical protein CPC08DRAFT_507363 [Agrocybe pediades]
MACNVEMFEERTTVVHGFDINAIFRAHPSAGSPHNKKRCLPPNGLMVLDSLFTFLSRRFFDNLHLLSHLKIHSTTVRGTVVLRLVFDEQNDFHILLALCILHVIPRDGSRCLSLEHTTELEILTTIYISSTFVAASSRNPKYKSSLQLFLHTRTRAPEQGRKASRTR